MNSFPFDEPPFLTKQQSLDFIEKLRKDKCPIHGIEVLHLNNGTWETSLFKTIWFKSQRGVYNSARDFIRRQMAGEWQRAAFKIPDRS